MHAAALAVMLLGSAVPKLKIFEQTRYLIEIIKHVIIDMKAFLLIQFIFICVFTIVFSKLSGIVSKFGDKDDDDHRRLQDDDDHGDLEEHTLIDEFKSSFNISIMSDFEHFAFMDFLSWVIFILTIMF
jgi:hypothetical protein